METISELFDSMGNYITDPKYTEILKLDKMLTESRIPHVLQKHLDGWQIIYPEAGKKRVMDAIENFGSYGHEKNLLEIMGLLTPEEAEYDIVAGYLTAQDVFKRIEKHWDDLLNKAIESKHEYTEEEIKDIVKCLRAHDTRGGDSKCDKCDYLGFEHCSDMLCAAAADLIERLTKLSN